MRQLLLLGGRARNEALCALSALVRAAPAGRCPEAAPVPLRRFTGTAVVGSAESTSASPSLVEETRQAWRPNPASSPADREDDRAAAAAPAPPAPPAPHSSSGLPEMDQVFALLEEMELQPGRNCIVGEGLALVDVGLYLQGIKVALDMEEHRPSHTMVADARAYAAKRAQRSLLHAHGWHSVTLAAADWRVLDSAQRQDYLAHCINSALGGGSGGAQEGGPGGHQHGSGCGSGCGHKH